MFLKTLEIFGFKSFADRVRIDFSEGVAALLGPNGCGKSNVVDAMKWVLGEQSSKSLRADKMEDIIFAGSEARKPLSVAEVGLVLSNEKEILPLDLPEISIRRRLYRSGESEYYINNNPVKLRDVRELFFDTGIGKSAYSIMEQGRIDQLLSTKPEDRRLVFEEAAGITRFRVRGQEAERKLERTEENMRHIEGILEEVRRSYNSLKGQAEKAEAYRVLKDQIFEVELELQLLRLKALMDDRRRREARLGEREKGRDALRTAIEGVADSITKQVDLVNSMERELVESTKRLYQLDLEKTTRDGTLRMVRERIAELGRAIEAEQVRERTLRRKLDETDADAGRRREALDELTRQTGETERNIAGFTTDIDGFSGRVAANEEESRRNDAEIHGLEEDSEHLRLELRAITEDIVTQLDQRLRESGYSAAERRRIEAALAEAIEHLRVQLSSRAALLEDASAGSVSAAERSKVLVGTLAALKAGLERLGSLAGLLEEYRRYTPSFLDEFVAPEGIITRKREIDHRLNEILDGIARRRQRNVELRKENLALRERIDEYRKTLEALRINLARLQTQRQSVEQEIARLARERMEQEETLAEVARATAETRERIAESEARIAAVEEERSEIERQEAAQKSALTGLEGEITTRNRDLAAKEQELKDKNADLAKAQGEVERLQIEATEIRTEIRELYANFQERYSRDLSEYETRIPDLAPSADLRPRLAELREQQRKLGSVNLMAPEEFAEVKRALRVPLHAARRPDEGPRGPEKGHRRDPQREHRAVPRHVQPDQAQLPLGIPTSLRRRPGRAAPRCARQAAGIRHRHPRAAPGQEARAHLAALGRREVADGRGAALRHLHGEAVAVLPARRDRRRPRRGERRTPDHDAEGVLGQLAVRGDHAQQADRGRGRHAVRSHHGGVRGIQDGRHTPGKQGKIRRTRECARGRDG